MKNQQSKNLQKESRFKYILAEYINGISRGLVAFAIIGTLAYFTMNYFNVQFWLIFPFMIILGLIISPFLSKINYGYKIQAKYEKWLNKISSK